MSSILLFPGEVHSLSLNSCDCTNHARDSTETPPFVDNWTSGQSHLPHRLLYCKLIAHHSGGWGTERPGNGSPRPGKDISLSWTKGFANKFWCVCTKQMPSLCMLCTCVFSTELCFLFWNLLVSHLGNLRCMRMHPYYFTLGSKGYINLSLEFAITNFD